MNVIASAPKKITVLNVLGNGGLFSKRLPNYEAREQQVASAQLIEQGIAERRHVVLELGTGGGKSFAGLVPAVNAALESGQKVVYATYMRSLQGQIAQKDAPFLAEVMSSVASRPITFAVLKGRGNYVCLKNVDELENSGEFRSREAAEQFPAFVEWVGEQRLQLELADLESYPGTLPTDLKMDSVTSTEECTGQRCKFFDQCFAERAKSRAKNADIVVVNIKLLCLDAMIRESSDGMATAVPDYDILIVDECFPAGTAIDDKAIEDIRLGDIVTAFNTETEQFEQRRVTRLFRNTARNMVRVHFGDDSIACTANHPFWTPDGWKTASDLAGNDIMLTTTQKVSDDANSRDDVLPLRQVGNAQRQTGGQLEESRCGVLPFGMRFGSQEAASYRTENVRGQGTNVGTNENVQPDELARGAGAGPDDIASYGLEADDTRREWIGAVAASDVAGFISWLVDGSGRPNSGLRGAGRTTSLQAGHRKRNLEDRDRGGRQFALQPQGSGSEEGASARWARVDRVEVLESGSDGMFGGVCPDGLVYNFEVEGLHTYTANGVVVHNCHNLEDVIRDTAGYEITPGRMTRLGWMLQKYTINHPIIQEYKPEVAEVKQAQAWADDQETILHRISLYTDFLKKRLEQDQDRREMRLGDERGWEIPSVTKQAQMSLDEIAAQIEDRGEASIPNEPVTIADVAKDLIGFGSRMEGATPLWLEGEERDSWLKLADQTMKLGTELSAILNPDVDGTWVRRAALDGENGKTRVVLEAKPIDVAPIGRSWFFGGARKQQAPRKDVVVPMREPLVVISMSATIATNGNTRMYQNRVGCYDALTMVSGSPFDYENNALLYLPGSPDDLVPAQKRDGEAYERYMAALSAEMKGLTLDANGGAFLLFTSRSAMNEVHGRIADDLRAAGLLVLKQGDMTLRKMIDAFKEDGNAVLFGLKTFGEGVDIQGDALRLVAIDKVPFNPPTDVIWKALCDHLDRNGGNSFRDLSLPSAIIVLKQFVGRLIRTKRDRGVMAILDGRISKKFYGREIIGNMPKAKVTGNPSDVQRMYARTAERARPVAVVAQQAPQQAPQQAAPSRFRRLGQEIQQGRFRRLGR